MCAGIRYTVKRNEKKGATMSENQTNRDGPPGDAANDEAHQSAERPFSVNRGCEGCLASLLFLFVCGLILVSGILQALQIDHVLDLLTLGQRRGVLSGIWAIAMGVGGYVAARRGRTTGWSNALVVGIFGLLFALGQLETNVGLGETLERAWREPGAHWPQLSAVVVTLPSALLGGLLWSRKTPS